MEVSLAVPQNNLKQNCHVTQLYHSRVYTEGLEGNISQIPHAMQNYSH